MSANNFKRKVERILKMGVEELGTRYDCQAKLVWNCRRRLNLSEEKSYEVISNWYFAHNHRSKDWRENPERVLRQLRSAISSYYRKAEQKCDAFYKGYRKKLSTTDILNITQITLDFRMQKFIFSLLQYALNNKDSRDQFRLPYEAIIKFDCCSDKSYKAKMAFCESVGLITKIREYWRQDNRARTYRINHSFNTTGDLVSTLEDGLNKIFSPKELEGRYSRWTYTKIREDTAHC